jgi:microcystin degradation protein MlrC
MAKTGARAARILDKILRMQCSLHNVVRKPSFLIPLHMQCTDAEPACRLYRGARDMRTRPSIMTAEIALGFPPADTHDCGPTVVVTGTDVARAEAVADELEHLISSAENDFAARLYVPAEAVREAKRLFAGRPIIVADTQDNPGAGGAGDTVGVLRALIEADAQDAVLALLHDPAAAQQAHVRGEGWTGPFQLGAHSGTIAEEPVSLEFTVDKLTDGVVTATGPMYRGNVWNIGQTALLRHRGVRVIVSELRLQAADSAILRHVGLDPLRLKIIALKSSVHFRADFQPMAGAIIVAASPGLHRADNRDNPYVRLRPGIRRMPMHD